MVNIDLNKENTCTHEIHIITSIPRSFPNSLIFIHEIFLFVKFETKSHIQFDNL